jgi:inhibitor of cysteine peptidase
MTRHRGRWASVAGGLAALVLLATFAGEAAAQPADVPAVCLFPIDESTGNQVRSGGQFAVVLPSNRGTGYSWSLAEDFFSQEVVSLAGHQYVAAPSGRIGAGGVECWVFRADNPGSVTITLNYSRPWERDVPPARTASYSVTVP